MQTTGRFLSADWRYLLMLNYEIDAAVVAPLVPRGTELDFYNGRTYVSVVAFLFLKTRVLGVPVPCHRNFEEINLRFYVRRQGEDGWRRGVVFIKEVVPRRAIAAVAVRVYNENYVYCPMRSTLQLEPAGEPVSGSVEYAWQTATGWNTVIARLEGQAALPKPGSEEEFITEHYWGYARQRDGGTVEYRVAHPQWRVWPALSPAVGGDVVGFYGTQYAEALRKPPTSAFIAEGSAVEVFRGTRLC